MVTSHKRIAIGGISHETNTFSPVWTNFEDFEIIRDTALLEHAGGDHWEHQGVEPLPTFAASAMPNGLVRKEAYLRLRDDLLHELAATLPVDGVFLSLHGAMEVEDIGDGEEDLVTAVRDLIGPNALISISLDLHGNISPRLVEHAQILTAYRTAPHRDGDQTRQRALSHLVSALQAGTRPVSALVKIPMLLAGESAVTEVEPSLSLYSRLSEIERKPGMMDASLLIGCAWTDSPHTSISVIAVSHENQALAQSEAKALAEEVWARREEFAYGAETAAVDDAVRTAIECAERPVFVSDSGDNVTAGAAGDIPLLAERLVFHGAQDALVAGLTDSDAVRQCAEAGIGAEVQLSIGGKLDQVNGRPFPISALVENVTVGSTGTDSIAQMAVVKTGGVIIILTAGREYFPDRASIAAAGVDPMAQKIVVVKLGYLMPDLYDHAPRSIWALSPGATDLKLERLPYERLKRPIFPLDAITSWAPHTSSAREI
jgi:microcystin degradation protein MlrC